MFNSCLACTFKCRVYAQLHMTWRKSKQLININIKCTIQFSIVYNTIPSSSLNWTQLNKNKTKKLSIVDISDT